MHSLLAYNQRFGVTPAPDQCSSSAIQLQIPTTYDRDTARVSSDDHCVPMKKEVALSYVKHVVQALVSQDPDSAAEVIKFTLRETAREWYKKAMIASEGAYSPPDDIDFALPIGIPKSWEFMQVLFDTGEGGFWVNIIGPANGHFQGDGEGGSEAARLTLSTAHRESLELVGRVLRVQYLSTKSKFVPLIEPIVTLCGSTARRGMPNGLMPPDTAKCQRVINEPPSQSFPGHWQAV